MNLLPLGYARTIFMDLCGESPIGGWATFESPAGAKSTQPGGTWTESRRSAGVLVLRRFGGMTPVSAGNERPPADTYRGPMHQRRTVGLDIPCPVARLQSRTPLLQAQRAYSRG